jgi:hypothetical protein
VQDEIQTKMVPGYKAIHVQVQQWCGTVRYSPATHVHHILQQVCGLVEAVHQGPGAGVDLAVNDDAAAGRLGAGGCD